MFLQNNSQFFYGSRKGRYPHIAELSASITCYCVKSHPRDLPGGAVVKNPPANAGNTGLSPGPGRSHMPRSNSARAPQLLSLRATETEPACHNY